MKQLNCLYSLSFGVFWSIGDFAFSLTPIMVKFAIMGFIVPVVATYMLYDDENSENPSKKQIAFTIFVSLVFVWFSYEAVIHWQWPVIVGMVVAFIVGLAALPIIRTVRKRAPVVISNVMDGAGEAATDFLKSLKSIFKK